MGERNSGTNFAVKTLIENFDIEADVKGLVLSEFQKFVLSRWVIRGSLNVFLEDIFWGRAHRKSLSTLGGWKHAPITPELIEKFAPAPDRQIICIIRHPVAWARSMHRNPFHIVGKVPKDFGTFLTTPWISRPRDGLGKASLPSPLVLWREKTLNYLAAAQEYDNIHVVRYEDLLLQPETVMAQMSEFLGPPKGAFRYPDGRIRPFVTAEETLEVYKNKVRETSLAALGDAQRAVFETHIGADLMQKLSYN